MFSSNFLKLDRKFPFDSGQSELGNVPVAVPSTTSSPFAMVRSTDQNVTGSTLLANDSSLNVIMAPTDTWVVTWSLYCTCHSGDGIKFAILSPPSSSLRMMVRGSASGSKDDSNTTNVTSTGVSVLSGSSASMAVTIVATVVGDRIHGGDIKLQYAQNVSSSIGLVVKQGSGVSALVH